MPKQPREATNPRRRGMHSGQAKAQAIGAFQQAVAIDRLHEIVVGAEGEPHLG